MKTIGMLGGMSWESTVSYYQALNKGVKDTLGGLHSAKICLYSVDFDQIEKLQHLGKWNETADILIEAAQAVERAGADFLIICTNTMHKVVAEIEAQISIPILHIADATANALKQSAINRVGLLGTQFTMQESFYKGRLQEQHGIDVLTPHFEQQKVIHDVIYHELCRGVISETSKQEYLTIIDDLKKRGAQAVILGCTEIALLVSQADTDVAIFDTTAIHANAAVEYACQ